MRFIERAGADRVFTGHTVVRAESDAIGATAHFIDTVDARVRALARRAAILWLDARASTR